jgi:hypothetical protein
MSRKKIGHSKVAPWWYLQKRGVNFVVGFRRDSLDPPSIRSIFSVRWKDRNQVDQDYVIFKGYYFDHNTDPLRENVFRNFLGLPKL